ncbi:TIR domain-containing protein [Candidatus Bathyarchaeota archaeon]|nr:MAG: TIR domain-containing protein [Candidatus Bathyarchaeota archaeon]
MSLIENVREEFENFPEIQVVIAEQLRRPGVLLTEKITELMQSCQVVVVVWTPNLVKSIMANHEIGYACALDKVVFPFVMTGMELKGLLQGAEYIEFEPGNVREGIRILIAQIRALATKLGYEV